MRALGFVAVLAGVLCIVMGALAAMGQPQLADISGRAWLISAGVACLFAIALAQLDRPQKK